MLVAVYGSLKQGLGNHPLLATSEFKGQDRVGALELYDLGWFPGAKTGNSTIAVEVYDVTADVMDSLDWLEGYDEDNPTEGFYNRITVPTKYGVAWIYIYNGDVCPTAKVEGGVW